MVGGKENLWFLDTLKDSISELVLPEETWKEIKTVFFNIQVTTYISELLNLGRKIMVPNSTLYYENLPELSPEKRHLQITEINLINLITNWVGYSQLLFCEATSSSLLKFILKFANKTNLAKYIKKYFQVDFCIFLKYSPSISAIPR